MGQDRPNSLPESQSEPDPRTAPRIWPEPGCTSYCNSDGGFYRRTIPFPARSNIYHKIKSTSKQCPKKRHIRIQIPKNTFVGPVFLGRFAGEEIVRKINGSVIHRRPHTNCKGSERERDLGEANNANYDREMEEIEEGK